MAMPAGLPRELTPDVIARMTPQAKREMLALLEQKKKHHDETLLLRYCPYRKQRAFHDAGAEFRERCFMAANQIGKTFASAMEVAYHATGNYPEDWKGKRFTTPTNGWVAGVTGLAVRDTMQRLLMGRVGQFGTGSIPGAAIIGYTNARGTADLLDTISVRHKGGGVSTIALKSYEQGREKFQGETLHYVALDEEPPLDIYIECLTRTNTTGGIVWLTFTPLLGMSDVVKRFIIEKPPNTHTVNATINDADHYTEEERATILASYPEHERDARAKGIPILGSGRVFPVVEATIKCDPFRIPMYWPRIRGHDFGWDHPAASASIALDPDTDTAYVYHSWRARNESVGQQTMRLLMAADKWVPISWPHDGLQHDKGSGEELAQQYRSAGAPFLPERATHPPLPDGTPGGNGLEAGISMMLDRMQSYRLKVFSNQEDWFEEFRLYHRKDGLIVKLNDDILSATRYALMMLRFAKSEQELHPQSVRVIESQMRGMTGFGVLDATAGY